MKQFLTWFRIGTIWKICSIFAGCSRTFDVFVVKRLSRSWCDFLFAFITHLYSLAAQIILCPRYFLVWHEHRAWDARFCNLYFYANVSKCSEIVQMKIDIFWSSALIEVCWSSVCIFCCCWNSYFSFMCDEMFHLFYESDFPQFVRCFFRLFTIVLFRICFFFWQLTSRQRTNIFEMKCIRNEFWFNWTIKWQENDKKHLQHLVNANKSQSYLLLARNDMNVWWGGIFRDVQMSINFVNFF